jgi:hypothetical protein
MKKLVQFFLAVVVASTVLWYTITELNSSQGYSGGNTLTIPLPPGISTIYVSGDSMVFVARRM